MGTTIRISDKQHEVLEYIKELSNHKWNRHPNYNPSFKDSIQYILKETKLDQKIARDTRDILKNDPNKAKKLLEYNFMTENKLMQIAEKSQSLDKDKLSQIIEDKKKEKIKEKGLKPIYTNEGELVNQVDLSED